MHIAVKEGIRNSPRKIELDSDRIDFHLNYVQLSFVRQKVTPKMSRQGVQEGFEINQKNLGDLRTIIAKNKVIDLYTDTSNFYTGFSPNGLMYLIAPRCVSVYQTDCTDLVNTPTSVNVYTKRIPFPKTPAGSTNNYNTLSFSLTLSGMTLEDYTIADPELYSPEDRYLLVENIVEHYYRQGVDLHWETFGDYYDPSSFIISDTSDVTASFSYKYDTSTQYVATVSSIYYEGASKQYTQVVAGTGNSTITSPGRVMESEYLHPSLNDNSFTTTYKDSVIMTMFSGVIGAYGDSSFAPSQAIIDYVTKPRSISLKFDRSCQLPDHTHEEIVDLAIKNILRSSESNFEKQTADIQLNK